MKPLRLPAMTAESFQLPLATLLRTQAITVTAWRGLSNCLDCRSPRPLVASLPLNWIAPLPFHRPLRKSHFTREPVAATYAEPL